MILGRALDFYTYGKHKNIIHFDTMKNYANFVNSQVSMAIGIFKQTRLGTDAFWDVFDRYDVESEMAENHQYKNKEFFIVDWILGRHRLNGRNARTGEDEVKVDDGSVAVPPTVRPISPGAGAEVEDEDEEEVKADDGAFPFGYKSGIECYRPKDAKPDWEPPIVPELHGALLKMSRAGTVPLTRTYYSLTFNRSIFNFGMTQGILTNEPAYYDPVRFAVLARVPVNIDGTMSCFDTLAYERYLEHAGYGVEEAKLANPFQIVHAAKVPVFSEDGGRVRGLMGSIHAYGVNFEHTQSFHYQLMTKDPSLTYIRCTINTMVKLIV